MARKTYPLERLDHKLGLLLARLFGTFFALAGGGALWSVLTLDDFSVGSYWPVLAMASAILIAAVTCWCSRPGFLDMMSEFPLTPTEARRRNVAVDDKGRR